MQRVSGAEVAVQHLGPLPARDRLVRTVERAGPTGHSQGGADAAQVASSLQQGDQLTLLQTAAAALYARSALHGAIQRGAVDEGSATLRWAERGIHPRALVDVGLDLLSPARTGGVAVSFAWEASE